MKKYIKALQKVRELSSDLQSAITELQLQGLDCEEAKRFKSKVDHIVNMANKCHETITDFEDYVAFGEYKMTKKAILKCIRSAWDYDYMCNPFKADYYAMYEVRLGKQKSCTFTQLINQLADKIIGGDYKCFFDEHGNVDEEEVGIEWRYLLDDAFQYDLEKSMEK